MGPPAVDVFPLELLPPEDFPFPPAIVDYIGGRQVQMNEERYRSSLERTEHYGTVCQLSDDKAVESCVKRGYSDIVEKARKAEFAGRIKWIVSCII